MKKRHILFIALILTAVIAAPFAVRRATRAQTGDGGAANAPAATVTWSGGDNNDSNWTSNGNWSGVGGAGPNDDLVFPLNAARKTNVNNFAINTQFRTLTFSGNDYVVTGNQIFLTNGITANQTATSGAHPAFGPNIILNGAQTFTTTSRLLNLNGIVNLNGNTLTLNGGGSTVFNSTINGAGSLTVNGPGAVAINGNAGGFGGTSLNGGVLSVGSGGVLGAVAMQGGTLIGSGTVGSIIAASPGANVISPGQGGTTTAILTSSGAFAFSNNARALEIDLNGTTPGTQYDRLAITGGDASLNATNLVVRLGVTPLPGQQFTILTTSGAGNAILGRFTQGTSITVNGRLFTITYNATSVVLTALPATRTWDGGGADNNWVTAENWVGDVRPASGDTLVFPDTAPADSRNTNNDFINHTFTLTITGPGYIFGGNSVSMGGTLTHSAASGTTTVNLPLIVPESREIFASGNNTLEITGPITVNGAALTLNTNAQSFKTIRGVISGPGGITKIGTGNFTLGGNNTYSGVTNINAGVLEILHANALGATGSGTNVANGAVLDCRVVNPAPVNEPLSIAGGGLPPFLTGALHTAGEQVYNGSITLTGNATINNEGSDSLTINGAISGASALTIQGDDVTLTAASPLSGPTTITGGELVVDGSLLNSDVTINGGGGRLGGSGTVKQITATGNSGISPGKSGPGILTSAGNVAFNTITGSGLFIDISGLTPGTQHDRLSAGGSVNLNGADLNLGVNTTFMPSVGQQLTIIQSAGAIIGQFAQGSAISARGFIFSITYNTNSVVLTVTQAPSTVSFTTSAAGLEERGRLVANLVRAGNLSGAATVDYRTVDTFNLEDCLTVSAIADQRCDYASAAGTVSFGPNETNKEIIIPLNEDFYVESSSENVTIVLSNPTGGATITGGATFNIGIVDADLIAPADRTFVANLTGSEEVPANNSTATGVGDIMLNAAENQITVNLRLFNLSSAQTQARIHGPAPVGQNGPVLFNLPLGPFVEGQTFAVTPAQAAQLKAGLFYFKIHTANFPNGEIRGQILPNPLESARLFVRQQYRDFLGRVPDQAGEDFWTGQIATVAGSDLNAIKQRRIAVSNAFFFELEYQQTGAFTYRLYREAFGNAQPFPNPLGDMDSHPFCQANPNNCQLIRAAHIPSYQRFAADRARLDAANLAASQLALATAFAQRAEFTSRYPVGQTAEQFVDALVGNIQAASGANLTGQRAALISLYNSATGGQAAQRGAVLFRLAEDNQAGNPINNRAFIDAEYNKAFVTTQYFGYLRRDADLPGLNFWLSVVNQFPLRSPTGQNGMVCAFITSAEYQQRFNLYFTRTNQSDCQ